MPGRSITRSISFHRAVDAPVGYQHDPGRGGSGHTRRVFRTASRCRPGRGRDGTQHQDWRSRDGRCAVSDTARRHIDQVHIHLLPPGGPSGHSHRRGSPPTAPRPIARPAVAPAAAPPTPKLIGSFTPSSTQASPCSKMLHAGRRPVPELRRQGARSPQVGRFVDMRVGVDQPGIRARRAVSL